MVFLGPFETQTASSVIACQSGVPSMGKTASGVMAVISRFTPGVETPGLGGRGCRGPFFAAGATPAGGGSCPYTAAPINKTPTQTATRSLVYDGECDRPPGRST